MPDTLSTDFGAQSTQCPPVFTSYRPSGVISPLVIMWPHNGTHVPEDLHISGNPLGWPECAFDNGDLEHRRHEAADWGMQDLFAELHPLSAEHAHITSDISRLVVDHNRIAQYAIATHSDDTGASIPANLQLCQRGTQARLETYYSPYHAEVDALITAAKDEHGFAVVIDMHSFTRNFMGQRRTTSIGTLKPHTTPLSYLTEAHLAEVTADAGITFDTNAPYDIRTEMAHENGFAYRNAAQDVARRNGVDYIGIEICNDLLIDPRQRKNIAEILQSTIDTITPQLARHYAPEAPNLDTAPHHGHRSS